MKRIRLCSKSRVADAPKGPCSSRLRLENLEDRRLLSVADLAVLAASSAAESVQYAPAANVSDALIDVASAFEANDTSSFTAVGLAGVVGQPSSFAEADETPPLGAPHYNLSVIPIDVDVYNTDTNVAVANVRTTGFIRPPSISVNNERFEIVGSLYDYQVVFVGGMSGTYTLTVTAAQGDVLLTKTFDVVVLQTKLATPANIVATPAPNSMTLTWDPVPHADYYYVGLSGQDGAYAQTTSYTVTGLANSTEYTFWVRAVRYDFIPSDNAYVTASTLEHSLTLTPIASVVYNIDVNVAVADVATTGFINPSITVDNEAFAVVDSQVVYLGGAEGGPYVLTVTAAEGDITLSKTYNVQILLATPSNLRSTKATTNSVSLLWDPFPGANKYGVSYVGVSWVATSYENYRTMTGLTSNTEYTFWVQAFADDKIISERAYCTVSTSSKHSLTVTRNDVVVYATDSNVVVADVVTTEFENPTITVDNDAFAIVNNQVVYLGGLPTGTYTLTVTATEGKFIRSDTVSVGINRTKLDTPANFRATATSSYSIALAWDPVLYATRYIVGGASGNWWRTDVNSFTMNFLDSKTEYTFWVQAFGDDMVASDKAYLTASTFPDYKLTVAPIDVVVYYTDANVAVADFWTNDFENPTITVDNEAFAIVGSQVVFVGGVEPGDHIYTVTASENGVSLSRTLGVSVYERKLLAPVNLRATVITPNSITYAWDPVPGADKYAVVYYDDYDSSVETNSFTVNNLTSNTEYEFLVCARSNDDYVYDSDYTSCTVSTFSCVSPLDVDVYNTDANVPVADVLTPGFENPTISVDNEAFAIVGAQVVFVGGAAGTYPVTVTASEGGVTLSETFDVIVCQTKLPKPVNLRATHVTTNSIMIAWAPVPNAIRYEVLVDDVFQTTDTNSYTATGLWSNTEYSFAVVAYADPALDIERSDAAVFDAATFACVSPLDIDVCNTDTNVVVADVLTPDFVNPMITVDNPAFEVVGAQIVFVGGAAGTYPLTVTASEGGFTLSDTFNVVVHRGKLETPANFRTTAITNSSITFAWDPVPYAVEYVLAAADGTFKMDVTSPYTWTGLPSDTEFLFLLTATGVDVNESDAAALTARTLADAPTSLSTDSPVLGGVVGVTIAPDSTATYAWYSVDDNYAETLLDSATSEYHIWNGDLVGKRLKAVVTYASGEFTGQVVSVTTANPVARESAAGHGGATSDAELANQFFVTTLNDVVADDGHISLREALANAPDGAVITFADEIVGGTINLAAPLAVTKSVTVDAWNLPPTQDMPANYFQGVTLDGANIGYANAGAQTIFSVGGCAVNTTLRGLTFTNSKSVADMQNAVNDPGDGAAVFADASVNLTIQNSVFTGLKYGARGVVNFQGGALVAANSLVADNASVYAPDGPTDAWHSALYFNGASGSLYNCTVANNVVDAAGFTQGGTGLYNVSGNTVEVRNSVFSGHTAADFISTGGTINVRNSVAQAKSGDQPHVNFYDHAVYNPQSGSPLYLDGAHGDYRLPEGSPAVDHGNAAWVDAENGYILIDQNDDQGYDLAGIYRLKDGAVDAGAYTAGIVPWVLVTISEDEYDHTNDFFADGAPNQISLREAYDYLETYYRGGNFNDFVGSFAPDDGTSSEVYTSIQFAAGITSCVLDREIVSTKSYSIYGKNLAGKTVTIKGNATDPGQYAGDSIRDASAVRAFNVQGGFVFANNLNIENTFARGADDDASSATYGKGGAIYVASGAGYFANVGKFSHNYAETSGGAVYVEAGGYFRGTRVTFENNQSPRGGAISNYGTVALTGTNSLTQNKASVAAFADIPANTRVFGGAIYNAGKLDIGVQNQSNRTTFSENSALSAALAPGEQLLGGSGGAIYNTTLNGTPAYATLYSADFNDNASSKYGGAISNFGVLDVVGNFNRNQSSSGGALQNSGNARISAVFLDNKATNDARIGRNPLDANGKDFGGNGGAIFTGGENASLTIRMIDASRNSAANAGGVVDYINGSLTFSNNGNFVFVGNEAGVIGGAIVATKSIAFPSQKIFTFANNIAGQYAPTVAVASNVSDAAVAAIKANFFPGIPNPDHTLIDTFTRYGSLVAGMQLRFEALAESFATPPTVIRYRIGSTGVYSDLAPNGAIDLEVGSHVVYYHADDASDVVFRLNVNVVSATTSVVFSQLDLGERAYAVPDQYAAGISISVYSTDPIASWTIGWGDGSDALVVNNFGFTCSAYHAYGATGTYYVTLTTVNASGQEETYADLGYCVIRPQTPPSAAKFDPQEEIFADENLLDEIFVEL